MSAKMAVSSSITWLIGCTRPVSVGASRTGSVTSTVSVVSRASSAAAASASLAAAIAAVTRSFRPLIAGPCTLRSSGVIAPSVLSSADTEPLLPSAATRTASSAASSLADATAASSSFSSCAMSDMASPPVMRVRPAHAPGLSPCCHDRDGRTSRRYGCPATSAGHDDLGLRRQRGLGLFHDRLERRRLVDGEIGQHLAVDRDARTWPARR